jgi:hypothetical protein
MMTHKTEHMTLADFETAVARMRDDDAITYAEGFIPFARYEGAKRGENIGPLTALQQAAYRLWQEGELHLTQKKLGDFKYLYLATRAPKCLKPTR